MIDHLSTYTQHFDAARPFYCATLGALGYPVTFEMVSTWDEDFPTGRLCAFGPDGKAVLWLIETKEPSTPRHLAFTAATRDLVHAFYDAGLASGGQTNGEPGLRPIYHEHYYGAFLLDPDGNNVEAVCHSPLTSE
ncbi:MAG: VOC family protein [Burkholderiaceae bacterium]